MLARGDRPAGHLGFYLEPIFLWPLDANGALKDEIPGINPAALRTLPSVGNGRALDEAIHLSHELGLGGGLADVPRFDELIQKLHQLRPDWPRRELADPDRLTLEPALATVHQAGIYNRCVVVQGARSSYTRGLELELDRLARLREQEIAGTALGDWLRGAP